MPSSECCVEMIFILENVENINLLNISSKQFLEFQNEYNYYQRCIEKILNHEVKKFCAYIDVIYVNFTGFFTNLNSAKMKALVNLKINIEEFGFMNCEKNTTFLKLINPLEIFKRMFSTKLVVKYKQKNDVDVITYGRLL